MDVHGAAFALEYLHVGANSPQGNAGAQSTDRAACNRDLHTRLVAQDGLTAFIMCATSTGHAANGVIARSRLTPIYLVGVSNWISALRPIALQVGGCASFGLRPTTKRSCSACSEMIKIKNERIATPAPTCVGATFKPALSNVSFFQSKIPTASVTALDSR